MEGKHRVGGLSRLWNNTLKIDIRGKSLNHILYDYNYSTNSELESYRHLWSSGGR